MGIYGQYIFPRLADRLCSSKAISEQRRKVIPRAKGNVLEVGIGSGLNFPFYDHSKVAFLWGLDSSPEFISIARNRAESVPFNVDFVISSCSKIPLASDLADTVVMTYILCTIRDLAESLSEVRRVMRRDGELIFLEHGLAPELNVRLRQNLINPFRRPLLGGCNINRPIADIIIREGFRIVDLETGYIKGSKHGNYNYWGVAKK